MQRFRVECNFGCRYFKDIVKAQRYFEKCRSKHLEVELWQVSYLYCPLLERFSARQDLLTFSGRALVIRYIKVVRERLKS